MEPLYEANKGYPLSIHRQLIELKNKNQRLHLFGCEGLNCSKSLLEEAKSHLDFTTMKHIRDQECPTHLQVHKMFKFILEKYAKEGIEAIYLSINLEAV